MQPRMNPEQQIYSNQKVFYYKTLAEDLHERLKRDGVPHLMSTRKSQTTGDDEYVVEW